MFLITDFPDVDMFFDISRPDMMGRTFSNDSFINSYTATMITKGSLFIVNDHDGIDLSGNGSIQANYICGIVKNLSLVNYLLKVEWTVTVPIWRFGLSISDSNIHTYRVSPSGKGIVDAFSGQVSKYFLIGFVLLQV